MFHYVCTVCLLTVASNFVVATHNVGLDPALFLGPSPPMLPTRHTVSPQKRWLSESTGDHKPTKLNERHETSDNSEELMENAETFWPSLRAAYYGVRVVPLSYSTSGTYGKYSEISPGVVATSYMSGIPSNLNPAANYKISGLAGSSYGIGQPGLRVFSGNAKTGWSGWGNGKWGHYGKG